MAGTSAAINTGYISGLCDMDRERYALKVDLCGFDPFELDARDCENSCALLPRVTMCDIFDFLVLRTSFVTKNQLKSYKALDGHNYVTSGWVRQPSTKETGPDTVVVVTQVSSPAFLFCGILRVALIFFFVHAGQSLTEPLGPACESLDSCQMRRRGARCPLFVHGRERRGVLTRCRTTLLHRVRDTGT